MNPTKTLVNRMKILLSTGKEADVRFLVGTGTSKKEFSAHKAILATASDVFERMFQFDANNGNAARIVEVSDVTPDAFQVLLSYIYTEKLDGLNQDNVFDVLYTAKKYDIADLVDACADCPKLNFDNVLDLLSKALFYELKGLIDRCWKFIDMNACAVLKNDKLTELDQALLCELFARDQLVLHNRENEIAIWNAALGWADTQCHNLNMEITGDNRRKILGPALFNIRFPLIPMNQFASIIVPTKMLTKDEMLSVFLYHANSANGIPIPSEYPLSFSSKHRAFSASFECPRLLATRYVPPDYRPIPDWASTHDDWC